MIRAVDDFQRERAVGPGRLGRALLRLGRRLCLEAPATARLIASPSRFLAMIRPSGPMRKTAAGYFTPKADAIGFG